MLLAFFYFIFEWANFYLCVKKDLIGNYHDIFIFYKFPRVKNWEEFLANPIAYLELLMHKKEVSENISLKSCSMITEIRAVEAMNKKQEKKKIYNCSS
jgi:hypothetical protein